MALPNESNEQGPGSKRMNAIFRRQFLKFTSTTISGGMMFGMGGIHRLADAGGFVDFL